MFRSLLLAAALFAPFSAGAASFSFIALGDMPYGAPAQVYPPYQRLIASINARNPDLVIHVGDTKSGSSPCTDEILADQLGFLNDFRPPAMYTPGDNEWTDCHRKRAGGYDPRERLDHIRKTYFEKPATSFGQRTILLTHQGKDGYPENARVRMENVAFITAHIVGSNNGFEPHSEEAVAEFFDRNRAAISWLEQGFIASADAAAIVVAIHGDMFEGEFNHNGREGWVRRSGFRSFGEALKEAAATFSKPVLLVFGDSHVFKQFRPFPKSAPNVLAVEVFGARHMHAVEISVDTTQRGVFSVAPFLNPAMRR